MDNTLNLYNIEGEFKPLKRVYKLAKDSANTGIIVVLTSTMILAISLPGSGYFSIYMALYIVSILSYVIRYLFNIEYTSKLRYIITDSDVDILHKNKIIESIPLYTVEKPVIIRKTPKNQKMQDSFSIFFMPYNFLDLNEIKVNRAQDRHELYKLYRKNKDKNYGDYNFNKTIRKRSFNYLDRDTVIDVLKVYNKNNNIQI